MDSKAAIHTNFGKKLTVGNVQIPDPRPDQVLVKLHSSGICHSQLHQMHNPDSPTPSLLGHEGTGTVIAKGSEVDHLKEGDLAIVTWVNRTPIKGRPTFPHTGVTYNEAPLNGATYTWGEHVLVRGGYVVKIPKQSNKYSSSIVGCAVLTGAGAVLHTAKVKPEDSVAIFGVGGVGLSALIMAKILEAYPIIAVDISDEKLQFAKKFGATHLINSSKQDPIEAIHEITSGGSDYSFDTVGLRITNEQILPSVRGGGSGAENIGGMAVLVGMPGKEMTLDPGHFMFHQRQFRGSLGATYPDRDFSMYLRLYEDGKLPLDELITKEYKLDDINEACDDLEKGRIAGRSIINFDS
ncbi:MAG: alcohol dehydrogenase [Chloroflexi bacterium]|nr:alcohol dehydrogenase [Chloroflexota bacterium]|tara:strand:+ start:18450 stop:19505 length:1056 start_codon:yes stop_codon:yes gene_type:complete